MFAKLINGALLRAPQKLSGDGVVVYNPPEEMYRAQGWKPVENTEPPEAPEGFCYEGSWEESDAAIVRTWTLAPLPNDIDEAEAYDIIFGGGEA